MSQRLVGGSLAGLALILLTWALTQLGATAQTGVALLAFALTFVLLGVGLTLGRV